MRRGELQSEREFAGFQKGVQRLLVGAWHFFLHITQVEAACCSICITTYNRYVPIIPIYVPNNSNAHELEYPAPSCLGVPQHASTVFLLWTVYPPAIADTLFLWLRKCAWRGRCQHRATCRFTSRDLFVWPCGARVAIGAAGEKAVKEELPATARHPQPLQRKLDPTAGLFGERRFQWKICIGHGRRKKYTVNDCI